MREKPLLRKRWTVPSELGQERGVVRELERAIREAAPGEPRLEEIATAVSEACLNAIEHGNRLTSALPVRVTMTMYADRYTVLVCDRGAGTDLGGARPPLTVRHKIGWEQPRGWGLQLMRHYADSVRGVRRAGEFCVELRFVRTTREKGGNGGRENRTDDLGEGF